MDICWENPDKRKKCSGLRIFTIAEKLYDSNKMKVFAGFLGGLDIKISQK